MASFINIYNGTPKHTVNKYPGLSAGINGENISTGELTNEYGDKIPMPDINAEPIEPQITPTLGQDTKLTQETIAFKDVTPAPIVESSARTAIAAEKTAETSQAALERARQQDKFSAAARATAGILRATGGVINANAKYQQTVGNNAFAIQQAQQQALMVASDVQQKMLKEQTKGKARGESAMISAVAQGQAAGGDLAQTAISNEALYAAEQSMLMEINAARQVFGLETQQRVLESSSRMAGINKDLEISQAIIGGVADVGMAGFSVMK